MNFDKYIYDKFSDSRLSVKKKNVRFLELLFKYNGLEFIHDRVVEIAYNYREPHDEKEQTFKNYLLAYEYIISSNKNDVDVDYLKKVYYLFLGKEIMNDFALQIQSKYYEANNNSKIEQAIIFHYYLYSIFKDENKLFREIFSLIFLTRELLKIGLCTFKMVNFQYNDYLKARQDYFDNGSCLSTFKLLEKIYKEERGQPLDYLENASNLTIKDIKETLKNNSELLKMYGINTVSIYGSFSKNMQRLNSDIDLYINVIEDITYKEKEKRIDTLKDILSSKFKRYVDIQELSYPILSSLIREIKWGKLIYKENENE